MTEKETAQWAMREARKVARQILWGSGIRAYLFGSRAVGTYRPFSDIDIALDARGKAVSPRMLSDMREAMEESHIPFRVDVVDVASAGAALRREIFKNGKLWSA